MNWDAIGATGENIGAFAVVISVIYLGVQIRKQTTESRLAATRELSNVYNDILRPCFEDKEFSALYLKAIQNYEDLPREERFRAASFIQLAFRMYEQHFVHSRQQNLDQIAVNSVTLSFEEWLTFPGVQQWWNLSNDMFVPEFRDYIAGMIEAAKRRGYHSSFKEI